MALVVEQEPNASYLHGAFEPIVYVLSDTDSTEAKFRYIADLYVGGLIVARVKVFPNANDVGVIRIDKLVSDYMSATMADQGTSAAGFLTGSIHTLGANTTSEIWSHNNGETTRRIELRFGHEYATSATTDPVETTDIVTGKYVSCVMSAGFMRSKTWDEGARFLGDVDWLADYVPTDSAKLVLSDRQRSGQYTAQLASNVEVINTYVTNFEWRTLAVINDGINFSADAESAYVVLFDANNNQLDGGHLVCTAGGTLPASANSDDERLQFFGCGPRNLTAQSVDASFATHFNAGNVAYYEVYFMDSVTYTPSNVNESHIKSKCYRFTVVAADCMFNSLNGTDKYNFVTLAFQNSFGTWDYQSFTKKHERTTSGINRKTFDQVSGNWDNASETVAFDYRGGEGGLRVSKIESHQIVTANTDIYDEEELSVLESLILSPRVVMLDYNGNATPVVITDTDWVRKRNVNEQGPFTYQINFKYAKKRPTTK